MTHAIRFSAHGGPEVLRWETVELPDPGPGELRIRHQAIGVNFIDTYHRTGLYPVALPSGLGQEGAGVVEAVGPRVTEFRPGDRVAYCGGALSPVGAYSEVRNFPAERAVRLPDDISFETAAAVMLKGLTAQCLVRRTHRVQPGDTVLIHAAAGGVGLLLVQWAKQLGATVIATAGNDEKAELVRAHGADHVIVYTREDFTERTRALTNGRGVDVVYDSVGRATFLGSLDSLRPLGLMVSFGNASGKVEPFDIGLLAQKGSLFLTRPTLFTYIARREDLLAMAEELFGALRDGWLDVQIGQRFPLSQAAEAHRALESRRTIGATLLLP
ncbi:NADPH:quinone reductase [Tepidiphilus margaritifer]|uniref:NADPH:quinone reductase n=1 Tax=Tepidiphilus margaritifer TaxID=203471 RepID=UPI00048FCAB7